MTMMSRQHRPCREDRTVDIDRISQLPEHIIHHILSFLSTKEVVHAHVLSKVWRSLCSSFPISDFSDSLFGIQLPSRPLSTKGYSAIRDKRERFINFVNSCLLRQREQNISIRRFCLSMSVNEDEYKSVRQQVVRWVESVSTYYVQELDVQICRSKYDLVRREGQTLYYLPENILSSKSLTLLRIMDLTDLRKSCRFNYNINLPSLRVLSLNSTRIDEEFIRNLSIGCPMIEDFALINCTKLISLQLISGFEKLKKVIVESDAIEIFEIAVPSLQILHLCGSQYHSEINVGACRNLQELKLKFLNIPDLAYRDIGSMFPSLKSFVLAGGIRKPLKISCPQLERLSLAAFGRDGVIIDSPFLRSFNYDIHEIPSLFSINTSSLHQVNIDVRSKMEELNAHYFLDIREFLRNFSHIDFLYLTTFSREATFNLEDLKDTVVPPSPEVKHLKLDFCCGIKNKSHFEALLDGLFWSVGPKSVTLHDRGFDNSIMEVLDKKLKN